MSDTRCQRECERWVREVWLPAEFGQAFSEQNVPLTSGGQFKFDAVSVDGSIVVSISTSLATMSSGKKGVGKMMKLRADMLFHVLASAPRKIMVFTEPCMYQACFLEKARGRTPQDIEFLHVTLPSELASRLAASRERSSSEVRPGAIGGATPRPAEEQSQPLLRAVARERKDGTLHPPSPRLNSTEDARFAPASAAELLTFASELEGDRIPTLAGRAAFQLRVVPAGIEIIPESTGKPRLVTREKVQHVLDEYHASRSLSPGHYQSVTFDASYLLVIIDRFDRHRRT